MGIRSVSLVTGSWLLLSMSALAGPLTFHPGSICDKKAGFCADHEGVSVAITKLHLGDAAEQALMARIGQVGVENFDPTWFTMSGGLTCKTKERTCWTTRYGNRVDQRATQTLFGHVARAPGH